MKSSRAGIMSQKKLRSENCSQMKAVEVILFKLNTRGIKMEEKPCWRTGELVLQLFIHQQFFTFD